MVKFLFALALQGCSAVRNNHAAASGSASKVVGTIVSMLQERGHSAKGLESLVSLAGEKATPGVSSDMTSILNQLVTDIENDVISKIEAAHSSTQLALDNAIAEVTNQTTRTVAEKTTADSADTTWFTCVRRLKSEVEDAETASTEMDSARSAQTAPCQLQADRAPFSGEVAAATFSCDHSSGDCSSEWSTFTAEIEAQLNALETSLSTAEGLYDDATDQCNDAIDEFSEASSAHSASVELHENSSAECATKHETRVIALCSFGVELQTKCEAVAAFQALVSQAEGDSNEHSESDREAEYATAAVTKCMISKIANGTDLDESILSACETEVDYKTDVGSLNLYADEIAEETTDARFTCAETTISFGSGQSWNVPDELDAPSTEYELISPYAPEFAVDSSSDPFSFCSV